MHNDTVILNHLRQIYLAYGKTDIPSFCGYILGRARVAYVAFFLLSVAGSGLAVHFRSEHSYLLSICLLVSFLQLRNDAFRKYKNDPAIKMSPFLSHN